MRQLATAFALCAALGACATTGGAEPGPVGVNNATGGTLVGAGPGGLTGSQIGHGSGNASAPVVSVGAGGLIGNQIGQSMDRADQMAASRTTQTALETGQPDQPLPWRNPDSGHYGTVVPGQYYQNADNQYCRAFQQTINVGGETQHGSGRACRQPNGTWRVVTN